MMGCSRIALVALLLGSSFALAGPKDDFSSPKAAVTSFFNAMKDADEAAAKNASVGTKEQQESLVMMMRTMVATRKLGEAAKAKFGEEETTRAFGPEIMAGPERFDKESANMAKADEKIDGNTAVLTLKPEEPTSATSQPRTARPEMPMKLQKVDGKWKIDLATLEAAPAGQPQPSPDQQLKMFDTIGKVLGQCSADIAAGKYKTALDARQGMSTAMMAEFQAQAAAAASAPAAAPTGAPAK
jgi:hypothetical protein